MGRFRILVLAFVLSVAVSGCWLQPDYDGGHSRFNGREEGITAANLATLTPRWSVDFPARFEPKPLISGGRVFVQRQDGTSVGVLAVDAATGATLWDDNVSPAGATGVFTNYPSTILEGELWQEWHGSLDRSPCVAGTVRLGQDGAFLGEDRSTYTARMPVQAGRYIVQVRSACPFVGPGPVFETLEVSDSRTKQVLWRTAPGTYGDVSVSDGQVITNNAAFDLAGCGAPTCAPLWRPAVTPFGDQPIVGGLGGPGGTFFVTKSGFGGPNGEVRALSRADGTSVWGLSYNAVEAEIAVDDERLYVVTSNGTSAGYLLVYDVDGCGAANCFPLWSSRVATSAWAPTVAGDVVYAAGNDGRVHAYRKAGCGLAICGEIASVAVSGVGISSLAVANGELVVSSAVTPNSRYRLTAYKPAGT
jgi:hypothetical protein